MDYFCDIVDDVAVLLFKTEQMFFLFHIWQQYLILFGILHVGISVMQWSVLVIFLTTLTVHCLQIYLNKIDYSRVALRVAEPLKRGGRLGGCVLLINRVRHPKRIPTTLQ